MNPLFPKGFIPIENSVSKMSETGTRNDRLPIPRVCRWCFFIFANRIISFHFPQCYRKLSSTWHAVWLYKPSGISPHTISYIVLQKAAPCRKQDAVKHNNRWCRQLILRHGGKVVAGAEMVRTDFLELRFLLRADCRRIRTAGTEVAAGRRI